MFHTDSISFCFVSDISLHSKMKAIYIPLYRTLAVSVFWARSKVEPNLIYLIKLTPVHPVSVADPGFPVGGGGRRPIGGADLRRGRLSVKMYVKTKELGLVGSGHAPTPPANECSCENLMWPF